MSLKVLCFGDNDFALQVVSKLRAEEREIDPQEQIIVDNVDVNGKNFLIFCVKNSELISSQSTGTTAILYFLDVNTPIFEQKHLLFGILDQRRQFEGLPIIIAFDKDQYLQIKDIVNNFELFKVKDRASMIKEIDLGDRETINEIFTWIQNQNQFNKTRTFDAPPKIVKMKPKYRESEVEGTQKKYDEIIRDKKLKGMNVNQQEEAYINKEKERIKNENMEKQLANFNRNKKKMSPYDIKATPNPKIQANLHFFLKDPKVEKAQQVNIKIQTDQFKQLPKPKPYVAKKTGVNAGTQIEPTQLFDFDKEVRPILQILTTRALQTATLQIEEHQQCLKIAKYKNAYNERVKKQKKHESDNIQAQMDAIKEKQRILQFARKKDQGKRNIAKKQSYYSLANRFLENIYKSASVSLYEKNYFPDEFQHHLKTQYIPDVLELAMKSYERILEKQNSLMNVFGQQCTKPIIEATKAPKAARKTEKAEKQMRQINQSDKTRYIHIAYDHPTDQKFSSFAKYLGKQLQGTAEQYIKSREEEIQEQDDKMQSGEIDEAQLNKIKEKDDIAFAEEHKEYLINSDSRVCFSVTQNRFEKPNKIHGIVGGVFCFDNEGGLVDAFETDKPTSNKFLKIINNLRIRKNPINMDDGIVINLEQISDNVQSVVFYTKINDAGSFIGENEAKTIRNAVYGLEFYEKAIPIHRQYFGEKIKWQQLPKTAVEGEEGAEVQKKVEGMFIIGYHLRRKSRQIWQFEQINTVTKLTEQEKIPELVEKITSFFRQSLEIFKVEQEVKVVAKTPSRGSKRKSRKNIEQKQKATPRKIELTVKSRILRAVEVNLKQNWSQIFNKLGDEVIEWKQFIENAPDGWYFEFRGKKLQNVEQLKKFTKVGDLVLKKVDPVIETKTQQNINEEDENKAEEDE